MSSPVKAYALRLHPGQDLYRELVAFRKRNRLRAACIVTCVGSLTRVAIRYANQPDTAVLKGHFEIVSLVGTLDAKYSHIHISVSDGAGKTIGGHLMEGSIVYTTAEIVLAELPALEFSRVLDPVSTDDEMTIRKRLSPRPR